MVAASEAEMIAVQIDRRHFLALGVGGGIAAVLPCAIAVAEDLNAYLTEVLPDPVGLRNSSTVGALEDTDSMTLREMSSWVVTTWQLTDESGTLQDDLRASIALKAGQVPSYLTEYKEGMAAIRLVRKQLAPDEAFPLLMSGALTSDGNFRATRVGRFRSYVSSEVVTLIVALGGFKRYGSTNYRGFQSGPFTDPDNPPFRLMEI
jgi:hypothetical protein